MENTYQNIGGVFVCSSAGIARKAGNIRAFLFDWDGVFNNGCKGSGSASGFSEADSMGTNLLRFGHWLEHGQLPVAGIITGAENQSAIDFAEREHFHAVYSGFLNKQEAFEHIQKDHNLKPVEIAFFFDDILDLPIAETCGLRIMIRRKASPAFAHYVQQAGLCDYITGTEGGLHAVREACELLLELTGRFEQVVEERIRFGDHFRKYLAARDLPKPQFYSWKSFSIVESAI